MKKLLLTIFMLMLAVSLAACTSGGEPASSEEPADPVEGGWTLFANESAQLPERVQDAFDAATKEFTGGTLTPVGYVAVQVVAGYNYMILCEETPATQDPSPAYKMAIVYDDPQGNVKLTTVKDFELQEYLGDSAAEPGDGTAEPGDGTAEPKEQMSGGWQVPDQLCGSPIPKDAKAAFDKAAKKYDGGTVEPMALLATQVVAGTNYAFLSRNTPSEDAAPVVEVVTVYEDTEGNAEISASCPLDPAKFNQ